MKQPLKVWHDICAVGVYSEYSDSLEELEMHDSTFSVLLSHEDGSSTWLHVYGGNGGSYGANLVVEPEP
jgi:hypothetical protein